MKYDPFKEYIRESEPSKREKGYAWHTAIGLQAVDGLQTSEYLRHTAVRNIEGEISFEEASALLQNYYEENPSRDAEDRTEEADKYLERFLRNLLLNENHPLHNRTLHISGVFKEPEKANIDAEKANIGPEKANIEAALTAKTAAHVRALQEALASWNAFGRSDVQRVLGLKPTRSSALLREMAEHGMIAPGSGHGKGK